MKLPHTPTTTRRHHEQQSTSKRERDKYPAIDPYLAGSCWPIFQTTLPRAAKPLFYHPVTNDTKTAAMNITKKIDRAFQWAGEKMGNEAKTSMTDEFKMLETEMALRFDGE